ncbi:MAG: hypothetical protein AAB901_01520, partial [Patescibacteria group bacterium]
MKTNPSLKQFAAWVIGLTDRYRFNPFVRTAVHITLLQVVLAAIMIFVFSWAIRSAQESTVSSITQHIAVALQSGTTTGDSLPATIEDVRERTYESVFFFIIALNALFRPNDEALAYALTFVESPLDQPAALRLGSDEGCRAW